MGDSTSGGIVAPAQARDTGTRRDASSFHDVTVRGAALDSAASRSSSAALDVLAVANTIASTAAGSAGLGHLRWDGRQGKMPPGVNGIALTARSGLSRERLGTRAYLSCDAFPSCKVHCRWCFSDVGHVGARARLDAIALGGDILPTPFRVP